MIEVQHRPGDLITLGEHEHLLAYIWESPFPPSRRVTSLERHQLGVIIGSPVPDGDGIWFVTVLVNDVVGFINRDRIRVIPCC